MTQKIDPRIHVDLAHLRSFERLGKSVSFLPKQKVGSILNGQHASRMKGRGLNFEELRHYTMGDDIRTIDWKVTARTQTPYVRVYTEERDRPVFLVVDQRMSMFFGSQLNMKSVTAAEAAALAAFAVRAKGDRVGGIIFNDQGVVEHRPRASAAALNRFLGSLAAANSALSADAPTKDIMSLNTPLEASARIVKTNALILVFSDFDGMDAETERLLSRLSQKNEVILFSVSDPLKNKFPDLKNLVVTDGELQVLLDIESESTRVRLEKFSSGRLARLLAISRKYGVPVIPLSSAKETASQILYLFGARRRQR
ncbi:MAG: DUF58 domain-containing protein [Paracoccaceae bacterium]